MEQSGKKSKKRFGLPNKNTPEGYVEPSPEECEWIKMGRREKRFKKRDDTKYINIKKIKIQRKEELGNLLEKHGIKTNITPDLRMAGPLKLVFKQIDEAVKAGEMTKEEAMTKKIEFTEAAGSRPPWIKE